jgi:hypothetical protein
MLALTETAADHEVPLLRDAIWNHYNRQTSLKVRIPVSSHVSNYHICDSSWHMLTSGDLDQGV